MSNGMCESAMAEMSLRLHRAESQLRKAHAEIARLTAFLAAAEEKQKKAKEPKPETPAPPAGPDKLEQKEG